MAVKFSNDRCSDLPGRGEAVTVQGQKQKTKQTYCYKGYPRHCRDSSELTLWSHSRISRHVMQPEGSVPHSQELSTCPYPEPAVTTPHPISPGSILILPPTYILVFLVVSFLLAFPPITYTLLSSPHSCYMSFPSHPPRLDHSNYNLNLGLSVE
jgi:hypothetical protein